MIASRNIADLRPEVQQKCRDFVALCAANGIDVIITSTFRDFESQAALYAQGRTTFGPRVTNAKAGQSFHNYGVAFDFAPIVNGKVPWNDAKLFTRCGTLAESIGLEWAGRWESFRELAHCQYTGGRTIAQLAQERRA